MYNISIYTYPKNTVFENLFKSYNTYVCTSSSYNKIYFVLKVAAKELEKHCLK